MLSSAMQEERSETRQRDGRLHELTYLGHIISRKGLKLQTGRKDAIKREEDRASVQRLLGMVGCLQKFYPKPIRNGHTIETAGEEEELEMGQSRPRQGRI